MSSELSEALKEQGAPLRHRLQVYSMLALGLIRDVPRKMKADYTSLNEEHEVHVAIDDARRERLGIRLAAFGLKHGYVDLEAKIKSPKN